MGLGLREAFVVDKSALAVASTRGLSSDLDKHILEQELGWIAIACRHPQGEAPKVLVALSGTSGHNGATTGLGSVCQTKARKDSRFLYDNVRLAWTALQVQGFILC